MQFITSFICTKYNKIYKIAPYGTAVDSSLLVLQCWLA